MSSTTIRWTAVEAQDAALRLCRGVYQQGIVTGRQRLSGADLRGAAKAHGASYATSRRAVLTRIRAAGIAVREARGAHGLRPGVGHAGHGRAGCPRRAGGRADGRVGGRMRTRNQTIALIRVAGYHDDSKAFTRLYVESHVAFVAAREAFEAGAAARDAGVPCACADCRRGRSP